MPIYSSWFSQTGLNASVPTSDRVQEANQRLQVSLRQALKMAPRVRKSLQQIYADYLNNTDRKTLQNVIRAFKGIQEKHYLDPDSFYVLAGWHGEPFRGPGKAAGANSWWWGGYCNHGNILFPTWHRAYLLRFEDALRSVEGCEDVTIPFWDECFEMK